MGSLTYRITEEDHGLTMKQFLRNKKGLSRTLLVKLKKEKAIFLNGNFTYLDHPLQAGDIITIVMNEEESENIIPEDITLDIVFEDEDLMVLNKTYGQCVHPTLLHPSGTLANGVVKYWQDQGFNRKFRAVNRLDKDTTGLLIVAKNQFAHQQLAIVQRKHLIIRYYESVVHGHLDRDTGTISAPIARKGESIVEREVREDGQEAVTHFEVLKRFARATYIKLKLETGRTHQIRVHMSHIGHPLMGDDMYGGSREEMGRQALHARYLSFPHPRTGEELSFEAGLPKDMKDLLDKLAKGE
ncbi:RluA family pseudouridine synthase [Ammoniphilus sp. YIM 78166]|uniref:RluA family pseudouridine synthase n=1 Tax=Ammoniphilus sp. YIM 78166 TaxID=1644106 RepID=UPI00106F601F|nr:RluA family pseudouridine synthase [Ammoniphilus sp. YIM 78166]